MNLSGKINFALKPIHILVNTAMPIFPYVFLFALKYPDLIEQAWPTILFVVALILYFLLIFVIDAENFPEKNLEALFLILVPFVTPTLIFFQGGVNQLSWYLSQIGVNIFLSVIISGSVIIYFGPLLSGEGWAAQKRFFKNMDFVWMGLTGYIVPALIIGVGLSGLLFYEMWATCLTNSEFLINLGIWTAGFIGTIFPYYRYLIKASVYTKKK